jgi:hypothetical protein
MSAFRKFWRWLTTRDIETRAEGITRSFGPADSNHAFCESMYARSGAPWHLRKLTEAGRKPGGGADTPALCGRQVTWDLEVPITQHHLEHACPECVQRLQIDGIPLR